MPKQVSPLASITPAIRQAAAARIWHDKPRSLHLWLRVLDPRTVLREEPRRLESGFPEETSTIRVVDTYWYRDTAGRWQCANPCEEES